jgi:polyisoprenyl-phosphate glycosyltransferase
MDIAKRAGASVTLDLVIPLWNEEEVLARLLECLRDVFSPENNARNKLAHVRFVMVDDGSRDRSAAIIAAEIERGLPAVLCRLSRNFGHQNAVSAGLDLAEADVVAVIDADLQDPPELIPRMVDKWREGNDVVYGQRRKRKEGLFKVTAYWLFYRLLAALADLDIPLDSGDFCLMDRRVVAAVRALPEKLRFVRGLRTWVGFRQVGLEYDRPGRRSGTSKYTFGRLYRLATDGVISSSVRPLQLAQVFSVSYLVLLVCGIAAFLWSPGSVPTSTLLAYLLIVSGNFVQAFCIYILGAYVGRTYLEAKGRPSYVVMELVGDYRAAGGRRE